MEASKRIMEVVDVARVRQQLLLSQKQHTEEEDDDEDTWVFPLVQMKPLGIQVDEQVTQVGESGVFVTLRE